MEFTCRVSEDGGMQFGERNRVYFKQWLKANPGALLKITNVLPESNKQRRYFEGAIVPLIAHYQTGMRHDSADDRRTVREWLKLEFNGEGVMLAGKMHRVGKSTKGRDALQPFLERVITWLVENYAPSQEALDPAAYQRWVDMADLVGAPTSYIEYLVECGVLQKI